MRRQTYGYLPSCKASPPIGWYQIILLGDRGTCVLTTCPGLHLTAERPGFELTTYWSQVQRPIHSATEPQIIFSVTTVLKPWTSSLISILRSCFCSFDLLWDVIQGSGQTVPVTCSFHSSWCSRYTLTASSLRGSWVTLHIVLFNERNDSSFSQLFISCLCSSQISGLSTNLIYQHKHNFLKQHNIWKFVI